MFNVNYNPDVLDCLANLSSDEVFTSPEIANLMLDNLPKDIWKNKKTTFLDPCTKSGVFLREITKRLIEGLKNEIPNIDLRINHILKKQVFGLATTKLTSLISKRSLYCSKDANGKYSLISKSFDDKDGNISFKNLKHTWKGDVCIYCSGNKNVLERGSEHESYAYEFIHNSNLTADKNMKFDVIIGNPPYQLNVGVEKKNHAILLFHKFVEAAISLEPNYVSMIIPSRWFTGGRGLDKFRDKMLNDKRIKNIVDYVDSRDCFNGVEVTGGAMYFLWDKNFNGKCEFTNIHDGKKSTLQRKLNEYSIFTRYNEAINIIDKVTKKENKFLSETVSVQTPFGFYTNFWDREKKKPDDIEVYTSKGITFTDKKNVKNNLQLINFYKVIITAATSEHAGQSDSSGKRKVLSTITILKPNQVCTQSYLVVNSFEKLYEAKNLVSYLKTKFCRFMLFQAITSQHISRDKFCFVPQLDFKESYDDKYLFKKFNLDKKDINFIDSMIEEIS